MNYNKGIKFKLIETPHALIIGHEGVNVREGQPLIQTDDSVQLATYLNRYLWGRANGEPLDVAHSAAMKECNVTLILPSSAAKTVPLTP